MREQRVIWICILREVSSLLQMHTWSYIISNGLISQSKVKEKSKLLSLVHFSSADQPTFNKLPLTKLTSLLNWNVPSQSSYLFSFKVEEHYKQTNWSVNNFMVIWGQISPKLSMRSFVFQTFVNSIRIPKKAVILHTLLVGSHIGWTVITKDWWHYFFFLPDLLTSQ